MAFKMKGWSAFHRNEKKMMRTLRNLERKETKEYQPQTVTRKDIETDITPQTILEETQEESQIDPTPLQMHTGQPHQNPQQAPPAPPKREMFPEGKEGDMQYEMALRRYKKKYGK